MPSYRPGQLRRRTRSEDSNRPTPLAPQHPSHLMPIMPSKRHRRQARELHARFTERPGSQHIAGVFAIEVLLRELERRRPRAVIEIGAGIGTMTQAILDSPACPDRFVTVEDHPFCLEQLELNLEGAQDRVQIVTTTDEIPPEECFELALVDGGERSLGLLARLADRATILVEGDRGPQRAALEEGLHGVPHLTCEVRTLQTDAQGVYLGGCTLIRVRPGLRDRLAWLRDRITTAWVYRIRALKQRT